MCVHMKINMFANMWINMCVNMRVKMCVSMCIIDNKYEESNDTGIFNSLNVSYDNSYNNRLYHESVNNLNDLVIENCDSNIHRITKVEILQSLQQCWHSQSNLESFDNILENSQQPWKSQSKWINEKASKIRSSLQINTVSVWNSTILNSRSQWLWHKHECFTATLI